MSNNFNVTLLSKKEGEPFYEEEFKSFLQYHGFKNVRYSNTSDGYIRVNAIQPILNDETEDRATMFIKCNKEMTIEKIIWAGRTNAKTVEEWNRDHSGCGCSVLSILVILITIIGISSCVNSSGDLDDDCNDSWIEEDYNGDGERDAEDYRIQTDAC